MSKLLLIATLLLVGCGSRPQVDSPPKPETTAKPAAADDRRAIVAFGDSLSAGYGAEPGSSYPDFLQKELDAHGQRYRIVNLGISGDTTTDGLNRVAEVLSNKPYLVIIEFGGNDGLRGLPIETTRANLEKIVSTIQASGAKVLLAGMTLPPNYGADYIKPFEGMYKDLGKRFNAPLIPFLLEGVGGHPDLMQQDGIHPTAQGNRIVAQTVYRALAPQL